MTNKQTFTFIIISTIILIELPLYLLLKETNTLHLIETLFSNVQVCYIPTVLLIYDLTTAEQNSDLFDFGRKKLRLTYTWNAYINHT